MDPYVAYEDRGPSVADIAMTPFKPSTHLWAYGTVPGMWSGTKGLYIPFNVGASKRAFGAMKTAFSNKEYISGVGNILKGTVGAVRPFGVGGSRIFSAEKMQKEINSLTQQNARRFRQMEKYTNIESRLKKIATAQTTHRQVLWNEGKFIDDPVGFKAARLKEKVFRRQYNRISDANEQFMTSMMKRTDDTAAKIARLKLTKKLTKTAFRAGKVASFVGAVSLTWDIAKMVGEPLGRAVVSEVDNALVRWEERFMPEIGGRLSMSYLSQGAATDRQRALQAMSKAQITGRSAFGQEARYAHL